MGNPFEHSSANMVCFSFGVAHQWWRVWRLGYYHEHDASGRILLLRQWFLGPLLFQWEYEV